MVDQCSTDVALIVTLSATYLGVLGWIARGIWRSHRRRNMAEETKKIKVVYRIQVGDQYTEIESEIKFTILISELVRGLHSTIKGPVAPEDIHITLRGEPADPPPAEWRKVMK